MCPAPSLASHPSATRFQKEKRGGGPLGCWEGSRVLAGFCSVTWGTGLMVSLGGRDGDLWALGGLGIGGSHRAPGDMGSTGFLFHACCFHWLRKLTESWDFVFEALRHFYYLNGHFGLLLGRWLFCRFSHSGCCFQWISSQTLSAAFVFLSECIWRGLPELRLNP